MLRTVPLLVACVLATLPLAAQTPRALVERGVQAMGGEPALRSVRSLAYDFYNAAFTLGQSELPESPIRATVSYGRVVHDYAGGRRVIVQETRQVGGAVSRQRFVATPTIGMNEINGTPGAAAPGAVAAQLRNLRLAPDRVLLAALDDPGAVAAVPARSFRDLPHDGVRLASASDTVTVWFDRVTGLPVVLQTVTDDPILGDRETLWWLTRWQSAGAALWPRQWDVTVNGQLFTHLVVTAAATNPPPADSLWAIPDSVAQRAQPVVTPVPPPAPLTVALNQLGPFVWRAEGSSHHSLVVEQPNQLVVVEGPQSTERSRALLDTLRSRFPGKRVGALVMTHYHWDHSGGLREFVAEGIPVITLEANAAFVRRVAAAGRTVRPDLQSQRRRTPTVRPFADSLVIGAGDSRVVLYRQPTVHAEGLLSAYVPGARVLFTSDVVNPPAAPTGGPALPQAGSAELVALARSRGLAVDRYAGGHGRVVAWSEIEQAAAQGR
jgi:glyoxylase-like metal-dependent hydrolase (beta-lactamase superfamily II)